MPGSVTDGGVTVAIPAYNSEKFLEDALESVFTQTHGWSECIVVDDGSTDATPDIARSFERVRYIRKRNGGDASARNLAIEEATGEFIAFLDADDVWLPDKLQIQMKLFDSDPSLGIVYSGVTIVDEDLTPKGVLRAAPPQVALRNTLILEKPYMTGIGSTAVLPTDVARRVRFDERLRASSDWAFACRVAIDHAVASIDRPLVLYRQHRGPQVHHNIEAIERDMNLVWNELFDGRSLPSSLTRYRRRASANLNLSLAASSHKTGDLIGSTRYLMRALLLRPDRVVAAFWRRYLGP